MFLAEPTFFVPILSSIFQSRKYAENWVDGIFIPVPKKGDLSCAKNYGPITSDSIFSKLFTTILNCRLLEWAEDNEVLIANQFGFRPGKSTIDAIFILHGIISNTLSKKKNSIRPLWILVRRLIKWIDEYCGTNCLTLE